MEWQSSFFDQKVLSAKKIIVQPKLAPIKKLQQRMKICRSFGLIFNM